MKEITLETKISDLLQENEDMINSLLEINPNFKKLKKAVINETLLHEGANLKEAAMVVGMKLSELVNILREKFNQEPLDTKDEDETQEAPEWINQEPKFTLNANEILKKDLSPLEEAHKTLRKMVKDEVFVMIANFRPQPLIDDLLKFGHEVYVETKAEDSFVIYVKKHVNTAKDFKEAGVSPYVDGRQMPRRYFLIATQLPFFIETCVKYAKEVGLDKETLAAVRNLMAITKPQVVDNATIVKKMELEAITKMVDEKCSADEVDDLLVKIADQQLYMQRIHAKCINDVQAVLNDDQYAKLIEIIKRGVEEDD
ncbi:hypothetical protein [Sulfurimonas sp.]|uniref:hypothetical protein n=1 Tax=Sulfurimonas sp. TaxID=2022749 RepID=UPI002606DC63|nr:hypothetical protein [Sulfurimonas sp.]